MSTESNIICPKCGAVDAYSAGTKGFGLGKAAIGGLAFGPVGLLGGLVGSKATVISCLKCGNKWKPYIAPEPVPIVERPPTHPAVAIALIVVLLFAVGLLLYGVAHT